MNALQRLAVALAALPVCAGVQASEPLTIRHNFFADGDSSQLSDKGEVLQLLLEKKELPGWSQNRAFAKLDRGNLDVISSQTHEAREESGPAIPYCLHKGLLGTLDLLRLGMVEVPPIAKRQDLATTPTCPRTRRWSARNSGILSGRRNCNKPLHDPTHHSYRRIARPGRCHGRAITQSAGPSHLHLAQQ